MAYHLYLLPHAYAQQLNTDTDQLQFEVMISIMIDWNHWQRPHRTEGLSSNPRNVSPMVLAIMLPQQITTLRYVIKVDFNQKQPQLGNRRLQTCIAPPRYPCSRSSINICNKSESMATSRITHLYILSTYYAVYS